MVAEGHGLLCFAVVSLTGCCEWAPKAAASRGHQTLSQHLEAAGSRRPLLWVRRDLKNHLVPSLCHGQQHLPPDWVAQLYIINLLLGQPWVTGEEKCLFCKPIAKIFSKIQMTCF